MNSSSLNGKKFFDLLSRIKVKTHFLNFKRCKFQFKTFLLRAYAQHNKNEWNIKVIIQVALPLPNSNNEDRCV